MTAAAHLQTDSCPACGRLLAVRASARAVVELPDPESGALLRLHVRVCTPCLPDIQPLSAEAAVRLRHALRLARQRAEHPEEQESSEP